ncbi:uncharacterized protein BO87DRAFT_382141 [Aspergillus neoniger CBS 115656]|uniref:Uncharacterized protein n=1 Tax=Aspergillus neoniger (strain CBS 115656) TaxID=1448310 RepID=A0A318YXY9_ASPNB|nr:hypothetical protein BO87DRAFT_382141 [Aspergillus neoniger CBS 115656]PYH39064.1 hypothetical protein BO87DRAFT_382141 [Aspergillus neoniger CBS 115656]
MADGLNPAEHFSNCGGIPRGGGECQVANLTGVKHILSAFVRRQTSRALLRIWTTDDRSSGPFGLDWGPWIAYATLARIGWLARQLDSDEDTCTSSSSSLLFRWFCALKPDAPTMVWSLHNRSGISVGTGFRLKKAGRLPWPNPGQKG